MTEAKILFVKINAGNQGPSASLDSLSHLAQEIGLLNVNINELPVLFLNQCHKAIYPL